MRRRPVVRRRYTAHMQGRFYALVFLAVFTPFFAGAATCSSLSRGSTGANVSAVQQVLYDAYQGFPSPTGYFGPVTEKALKQWQGEHGIEAIGIVGPKTAVAMKITLCSSAGGNTSQGGVTSDSNSSVAELIKTLLAQIAVLQAKLAVLKGGATTTTAIVTAGGGGNTTAPAPAPTPTPQPAPSTPAPCSFNGQSVAHGASVTAYKDANATSCASEQRICSSGALSGSYANASCTVQQSTDPLSGYWPITSGAQIDSLFGSISWEPSAYNRIFTTMAYAPFTSTIPLPNDVAGMAVVQADYSQAVVYSPQQRKYYMFFGVSLSCTNHAEAPDSIALAESTDGVHFAFARYLIEPQGACTTPSSSWPTGKVFQYNDPSALLTTIGGQEYVYVSYTVGVWDPSVNPLGYGNIGMAAFLIGTNGPALTYKNDTYLTPDFTHCPGFGFSRPSLEWTPAGTMLWFDNFNSNNRICKIPVTNTQQLSAVNVVDAGTTGLNIEAYRFGNFDVLLTDGGAGQGVQYKYAPAGTTQWSAQKQLSPLSGQGWDSGNQGGGAFLVNPDTCKANFYFAGVKPPSATGRSYDSIDIGSTDVNSPVLGKALCRERYGT